MDVASSTQGITMNWMKALESLAPRHKGERLYRKLHKDVLVAGDIFQAGDDCTKSRDLLTQIFLAHHEFNKENPFRDMFGEYMQENELLNSGTGQFFTPYNVCDVQVEVLMDKDAMKEMKRILDPASGTGRYMLSTAKFYAKELGYFNFMFTNIDIDYQVWVFCVFNAILNNIPGLHILGDSLTNKFRDAYVTIPTFLPVKDDKMIYTTIWKKADTKLLEEQMTELCKKKPRGQQGIGGGNAVIVKPTRKTGKKAAEAMDLTKFFAGL